MKKTSKIALLVPLVLFLVVLGLVWLGIVVMIFALIYNVALRYIPLIRDGFLRKTAKGIFLFVLLLSTAISIKLLAFDIYKIPSSSMENLLYPGDVIVVNKLKYGPKLPSTPFEIPWINLAFYMNEKARSKMKETWWDYKRWDGITSIKQGDVFVFALYGTPDFFVIKRCVGLSGDTLSIRNGEIYTNNELYIAPGTVKNNCQFRIKDRKLLYKVMDSLAIYGGITRDYKSGNFGYAAFSKDEFTLLKEARCIDLIKKNRDGLDASNERLLKTSSSKWTLDNMGPIIIPKKGMQIILNPDTFMLYKKVMVEHEKNTVVNKKGLFFVNGKRTTTYTFKQNYYFMMGDNRMNTIDSRSWGFLPESYIVGKVQCILFSNKSNEFQWNRLFKAL